MAVCVLIPAYEPEERFAEYAALCAQRGPLVVVDDGSGPQFAPIFEKIAALPGCTVLHHGQEQGQGRGAENRVCPHLAFSGGL